ncbi:MAG: 4Fe-4S binding protein [Bacillota bacterium]
MRRTSQFLFLGFMTFAAVLHQIRGGGPQGTAPVDALCPFGGIEALYKLLAYGEFLKRTNTSNLVLLAGVVIMALVAGKSFCSWICPLGTLQEWLGSVGKRLFGRTFHLPGPVHRILSKLKYVVLALVLAFTWYTGDLIFRAYDPWVAYAHLYNGVAGVFEEYPFALILLGLTLLLALFTDRPWCRYACPLGALLEILGRLGLVRLRINEDTCLNCNRCSKACSQKLKGGAAECNGCADCVSACPVPGTLRFTAGKRVVAPLMVGVITLGIFLGTYGVAKAAGIWNSKGSGTAGKKNVSAVLPVTEQESQTQTLTR